MEPIHSLIDAQLANAEGVRHLMRHDPKTGQLVRVTGDAREIDRALKSGNAVWIYTKDPNVQAFTDLLNRAIDKPSEHVEVTGADGSPLTIHWQMPGVRQLDDEEERESGEVRKLPGDLENRFHRAKKVNGHVEPDGKAE